MGWGGVRGGGNRVMLGKGVMSACDLGYALLALLTSTLSVNTQPCAGSSTLCKAKLDQSFSGLVGTRTPYGVDPPTRSLPDSSLA